MAIDKKAITKKAIGKVTMYDAARTYDNLEKACSPCPPSDSYPCLYISGKDAPALKGQEVGDEFTMVVKAKVRSHSQRESTSMGKTDDYDIELQSIGVAK